MADAKEQIIRIWDEPESRIQFLEMMLDGKAWEAVVYDSSTGADAGAHLNSIEESLKSNGYSTSRDIDEYGQSRLHIKNFGNDTKLTDAIREMGLTKGVGYKLSNIGQPLGKAMHQTRSLFKQMASDKARAIGSFYLLGDAILMFSGMGNKKEDGKGGLAALADPANALESVMGVAATVQSLIYMGYAKQGKEQAFGDLMARAEEAELNGTNLFDDAIWQQRDDSGSKFNPLNLATNLLKSKPLESGAAVQILGKVAMFGSGLIRLNRGGDDPKARSGAIKDMFTSVSSATGWSLMMKKANLTADEDKLSWSNPGRVWQEIQANPNRFASAFLGAASLSGVAASIDKGNKIQSAGNATYIAGDAIMFATKNDDYGDLSTTNAAPMIEAAKQFFEATPMILGEVEQQQFVGTLSQYLAEKTAFKEAKKAKTEPDEQTIAVLRERIEDGLRAELPPINRQTYALAGKAAALISHFHPAFADSIADSLTQTITQLPGVSISADELKARINHQLVAPDVPSTKLIHMKDVAEPLSELAFALPGGPSPHTVNALFDSVNELIRPTPAASQQLEDEVNKQGMQLVEEAFQGEGAKQSGHQAALAAQRANQNVPAR